MYGNPMNNPDFYREHQPVLDAMFAHGTMCPVSAGILQMPHEFIHHSYRAQEDNDAIDAANQDDPMDLGAEYGDQEEEQEGATEAEEGEEAEEAEEDEEEQVVADNDFIVEGSDKEDSDESYPEEEDDEDEDDDEEL
jgi:hypothetical protein